MSDILVRASAFLGMAVLVGWWAGCGSEGRREPGYGPAACDASFVICYGPEQVANLDVGGSNWAFCAPRFVVGFVQFGGYGRSESWFTWGADGAIEDVRIECREDGEAHITGERDGAGRMIAYQDTSAGSELRYEYGDDDLLDSAEAMSPSGTQTDTYEFAYEGSARLLGMSHTLEWPGFELGEQVDVSYDDGVVSSLRLRTTGAEECDQTVEVVRDAGRIVEIVKPGCPSGRYHATFEWEDAVLVRSTGESGAGSTESRYTFADGKLTYMEEDLDGEPSTTSWYEYDSQGRLDHLVWWGHRSPNGQ